MQSSSDAAFDEFQFEFLAYLQGRLGVQREEATALLSQWLAHHPHGGRHGLRKILPDPELAGDQAAPRDRTSR
ncbi:MAG TPA: hypothetical protein VMS65_14525 [Polyangiaceae bacterium]|nr:hypothetical protein [Polyangiaceae bacterium]